MFCRICNLFHEKCNLGETRTHNLCIIACCPPCYPIASRGLEACAKIGWVLIWCVIELLALCYTCSLLQGCGLSPSCSQIFFISMFNLGTANGAKVGLKLRLANYMYKHFTSDFYGVYILVKYNEPRVTDKFRIVLLQSRV